VVPKTYVDQIDSWHARRVSTLKNDLGWLTLVGFDWLKEGVNNFSGLGTITLQRGKVNVQIAEGLSATIGDRPFASGVIRTEADNKGPDRLRVGSKVMVVLKRGDRFALRIWDTNAENRKRFVGIERYAVSEQWQIHAEWEEYKKSRTVKLSTAKPSYSEEYNVPGVAVINVGGNLFRLEPIIEEGSDQLFFIFLDGTSGRDTFVDGRYLYASLPEKGYVVLDFNKAINPPSAFTRFATSPLAPESNRLKLNIEAGEKKYRG
jgi:uncharacterized protein (DUF1684 family)